MRLTLASATLILAATPLWAQPTTVTDFAGREVTVDLPVDRVLLGEGRQLYVVAALDKEAPFQRVVGWRDDLKKNDPGTWAAYKAKWPDADALPTFGGVKDGTFDIEQAVTLKPDVVMMNIVARTSTEESGAVEKLAAAGIPVVYVDFREKPMQNTEPSLRLIGQLFDRAQVAEDLIAFRKEVLDDTAKRLASVSDRPVVFVERAGGYSDDCCMSFGDENFGRMVEMAGGTNMARDIIPATFGTVNPEQIIAADPAQIVVTGGEWESSAPGGAWVGMGPGSDMDKARDKLAALMQRPAFTGVKAVQDGNVHAIWHQFYNSPYQFAAVQQLGKWLHPEAFADVDPSATMQAFHEKFLPVGYQPGLFVSLKGE
ncbi:ABC transporter substrate-binding protein [Paracoccus sphaerophysae]|uniref:ABC transporter substrate-binding protein n=1 Tax=Paracoccus sphaerophysae TaxID=690417 RepID=A0A099FE56_9RHOB|nr:ABC transporter substrate-binding protein [Paracoccus sphaerophysae]KGJ09025.1 ABC transporter substrate-binding protein [Paracoccus sphaerophysae]